LPEDIEKTIQDRLHGGSEDAVLPTEPSVDDAPEAGAPAAPQPGAQQPAPSYGSEERRDLDSLFDNSGEAPADGPEP